METILLITGILLMALGIYDLTYTTLAPRGAGILTGKLSHWIWSASLFIAGKKGSHGWLNNVGHITLYSVLLVWIVLIWLGNTLILYSDPVSLRNGDHEFVTGFIQKFYYTGYVLSTMGNGEFMPVEGFWEVYAAVISFSGLVLITIAISYLIPVVSAVAEKRALSTYISSLGRNPIDILAKAYNGEDFKSLENHLLKLHQEVLMLIQNHQAYPVLHYFHSTNHFNSSSINICALDEALSILLYAVKEEYRPSDSYLMPVRYSVSRFLETLHNAYINPSDKTPDPPDLQWLQEKEELLNDDWHEYYSELVNRRTVLQAYLDNHGWTWDDMSTLDYTDGLFDAQDQYRRTNWDD